MRWLLGAAICGCALSAAADPCRLRGQPFVETATGARTLDLRRGEEGRLFFSVPVWVGANQAVLSESGLAGRTPYAACPEARVKWQRVEPLMEHTHTRAPNADIAIYANAVVFGPHHGTWIGFDRIEETTTDLPEDTPVLTVRDATPSASGNAIDRGAYAGLGVMRVTAEVVLAERRARAPADLEHAFRYTVRADDGFVGWLTTFFNVPYLFGSAGKGVRAQAERYYGADCADVLVAALRRSGLRIEYTSVGGLIDAMKRIGAPIELVPCGEPPKSGCGLTPLRWGTDVRAGDLLALDYVGSDALPRPWDHVVALIEDRGPGGRADGVFGSEDLIADSGDREGLKFQRLAEQGHVRVQVLRPSQASRPRP